MKKRKTYYRYGFAQTFKGDCCELNLSGVVRPVDIWSFLLTVHGMEARYYSEMGDLRLLVKSPKCGTKATILKNKKQFFFTKTSLVYLGPSPDTM